MLEAMGLTLIQGPPNSGRAEQILAKFRAQLDREPVLVVPTGDDVAGFESEICADGSATLGGSIVTFGALTAEVARSLAVAVGPPLSPAERHALVRAAIRRTNPRRLRRSASRPGFAPALDALIAELQAALLEPREFARLVAELEDAGYETELAQIYAAYVELRQASGRADGGVVAAAAIRALRADPEGWTGRPVLIYGFDDLNRAQTELVAELARAAEVTVAVNYADRRALAVRARLLGVLREELGAGEALELESQSDHTTSGILRHLDRNLFETAAGTVEPDAGLVLLQSAGARGEAEAIGIEIARLLGSGFSPDEVAIVARRPESCGPVLASVLRELGVPIALEASLPLASTCVGGSLIALCRAAADEHAVEALLFHLRSDPSVAPASVDQVERRIRRGDAQTVGAATDHWEHPPRHLQALRDADDAAARLRALAWSARALAEGAHRGRAPLAGRDPAGMAIPFSALELRAGGAAAELLEQLATVGSLPGCEQPDLADAIDAIESASVPHWRGPASGRVRILSPYRARTVRARALFCAALQDGEFPSSSPPDPLLSEERRREIGNRDLRRSEPADEERYLFHACVSRPTERLFLSWQNCDEDGGALARSPFVDEVLDLVGPDPARAEELLVRSRGPERAVLDLDEATSSRGLARALAVDGWGIDREAALERIGVTGAPASAALGHFDGVPDPRLLPGPLEAPPVLADLGARAVFSANSLEGWITCPYKWFVDHELAPLRLEPEADPLWVGGVIHGALEQLYREAPGEDSIPRPADVGHWRRRFGELLDQIATDRARAPLNQARRAALARSRIQVEAFLESEAAIETEFRPESRLLELGFGPFDDIEEGDGSSQEALKLGDVTLRGRIDRIDLATDGRSAVVRDYKTGKRVPRAEEFTERGTLQIQLYMRVAQRVLGLEPLAGLYQPLGASSPGDRKPRGIAVREDERLDGLGIVRTDRQDPEQLEQALDHAEAAAIEAAGEMRRGLIARRPIGGSCPKYCNYQPICRLERALGAVGEESSSNGDER